MKKKNVLKNLTSSLKKWFLLIFLCITNISIAQKDQQYYVPDSLKNKTYKELYKALNLNSSDSLKSSIYAWSFLNKAKNEKDTIKIAAGFTQVASILIYDFNEAIKYSDSIILLTRHLKNDTYPGFGYMTKGMCLTSLGYYDEALQNYLIAYDYASKNNNQKQLFYIKNNIAQLKYFWGNYHESIETYKNQLVFLENITEFKPYEKKELLSNVYFHLSNIYISKKSLDSAQIYIDLGIVNSLKNNLKYSYYNFVSFAGIASYYKKNYQAALDSLDKALPYDNLSVNGLFNQYYYRGLISNELNKKTEAFDYFKKADSIYETSQDMVPEVRDIKEYFVNYYKETNDIENQLKYIDHLLHVDSIINKNSIHLNETIVKKYDTPQLLAEKEKIIKSLNKQNQLSNFYIYFLSALLLLASLSVFFLFKKKQQYKNSFKKLVSVRESKENNTIKDKPKNLTGIPKETIESILNELTKFEEKSEFIDNNVTLNSLSKTINTNSNYLSKVINFYKQKNFSNYLADLRIDYCVERLKTDSIFRKYSIKAIATEIGFNNTESFSKAFYKKTGIYPSYFIKELEKMFK